MQIRSLDVSGGRRPLRFSHVVIVAGLLAGGWLGVPLLRGLLPAREASRNVVHPPDFAPPVSPVFGPPPQATSAVRGLIDRGEYEDAIRIITSQPADRALQQIGDELRTDLRVAYQVRVRYPPGSEALPATRPGIIPVTAGSVFAVTVDTSDRAYLYIIELSANMVRDLSDGDANPHPGGLLRVPRNGWSKTIAEKGDEQIYVVGARWPLKDIETLLHLWRISPVAKRSEIADTLRKRLALETSRTDTLPGLSIGSSRLERY